MLTVKINNKKYEVPVFQFSHMTKLESEGVNIIDLYRKKQVFSIAAALIMIVADCDMEDACFLAEQHVMGGGNLDEIWTKFAESIGQSAFFIKLLGEKEETEKTTPKKAE